MTDFVACFSKGKGTQEHVKQVIAGQAWEKVFLIIHPEAESEVPKKENITEIVINPDQRLPELTKQIKDALNDKISIMETAVNIISGEGKEHMALLSALLSLGIGIRLVAFTTEGVKEV